MSEPLHNNESPGASRRQFLKDSATLASVAVAGALPLERSAHAAGSGVLKIGLIGCGDRGTGAAVNAMNSGDDVQLVAMGDLFRDQLDLHLKAIKAIKPTQVNVNDDHCFVGFDAYERVIASDVDVVLIAAASHFHPLHFKAAIDAGKHVFCEKPHALDAPGLKLAMKACDDARKKGLSVVSGLCWRYDLGVRETLRRIQDGAIGDVVVVHENYLGGPYRLRATRPPEWSEMEYQYRNWYHFNWLSGDQTGQQLIHSLDKASWVLGDRPPIKAYGIGGRQVCLDPKYGDQFDNHGVVFDYDNGVRVFGFCRDIPGCHNETTDTVFGTKGRAYLPKKCRIEGETNWEYSSREPRPSMYDVEHQELFDAIRTGKPINNGDYMFTSTMLGILAQMVCYTGKEITWERAMQSTLDFTQERYAFDAEPPVKPDEDGRYESAMPGLTPFV